MVFNLRSVDLNLLPVFEAAYEERSLSHAATRLAKLVAAARLPTSPPRIAAQRWLDAMRRDKKVEAGSMRFVLLERLGHAVVRSDVDDAEVVRSVA